MVGGAPYTDSDPPGQIDRLFEMAREFDVDVDMHLDFGNTPEGMTIEHVCNRTEEFGYGGRVTVGHMTQLSTLEVPDLERVTRRLADVGVAVTVLPSTDLYLMGRHQDHNVLRGVVPVHKMLRHGVNCNLSSNNVLNPFTPFGDCSLIRMANLYANICQVGQIDDTIECFDMVTRRSAELLNLDDYGVEVGKSADLVVIDNKDRQSAVAELSQPLMGLKKGRPTFTRPARAPWPEADGPGLPFRGPVGGILPPQPRGTEGAGEWSAGGLAFGAKPTSFTRRHPRRFGHRSARHPRVRRWRRGSVQAAASTRRRPCRQDSYRRDGYTYRRERHYGTRSIARAPDRFPAARPNAPLRPSPPASSLAIDTDAEARSACPPATAAFFGMRPHGRSRAARRGIPVRAALRRSPAGSHAMRVVRSGSRRVFWPRLGSRHLPAGWLPRSILRHGGRAGGRPLEAAVETVAGGAARSEDVTVGEDWRAGSTSGPSGR